MAASPIVTADISEEFIRAAVDGSPVTLKELAIRHRRSYPALRKAASEGKWSDKAVIARAERDAAIGERIAQRNSLTQSLMEQAIGREIDIRLRHALIARALQQIALERLAELDPSELSASMAVSLMRTGIEEERIALGLANVNNNICESGKDDEALRKAVEQATAILRKHSIRLGQQPPAEMCGEPLETR